MSYLLGIFRVKHDFLSSYGYVWTQIASVTEHVHVDCLKASGLPSSDYKSDLRRRAVACPSNQEFQKMERVSFYRGGSGLQTSEKRGTNVLMVVIWMLSE